MKILFIQSTAVPQLGVMQLSAILKRSNHKVKLCLIEDSLEKIKSFKPDLIASSITTGEHKQILKISKKIKQLHNIPIILGGPHPTFFPDVINNKHIDMICIGEGDLVFEELANNLQNNKPIDNIQNLWIKKDNKVIKNELRNLVENLDTLPFADRSIYYDTFPFLKESRLKIFSSGRGCYYNCTFCFNHSIRKLYHKKGTYVRKVSVDYLINEIKKAKQEYPMKTISFNDDTFIFDKPWLKEFSQKYRKEINIPFVCNVRGNLADEDTIKSLKKANCYAVGMGIETGNNHLRNVILKKGVTNKQILETGKLVKKYKLKLKTYNMFGYPGETLEDAFETLKLNAKIKPDQASTSIIQPYPGTEFCEYAKQQGCLCKNFSVDDVPETLRASSPLKIKNKKALENLQTFAFLGIKHPFLFPLIKILIKLPPNPIYKLIAQGTYGYYMSKYYQLTIKEMLDYAFKMRYKFA